MQTAPDYGEDEGCGLSGLSEDEEDSVCKEARFPVAYVPFQPRSAKSNMEDLGYYPVISRNWKPDNEKLAATGLDPQKPLLAG